VAHVQMRLYSSVKAVAATENASVVTMSAIIPAKASVLTVMGTGSAAILTQTRALNGDMKIATRANTVREGPAVADVLMNVTIMESANAPAMMDTGYVVIMTRTPV
jgi:hypothetical protein